MIIAVTDRTISVSDLPEQVEAIASSSPDMIILREKDLSENEYAELAAKCLHICDKYNIKFCVNSFIGVAGRIGIARIQLPFLSFMDNNDALTQFQEVWVSVHSLSEATEAERLGATHLIYGNIFETTCKPGADGRGVKELADICASVNVPVFAIGGIDKDNIKMVIDAGCKGVCIRGSLMTSKDPRMIIDELRKTL